MLTRRHGRISAGRKAVPVANKNARPLGADDTGNFFSRFNALLRASRAPSDSTSILSGDAKVDKFSVSHQNDALPTHVVVPLFLRTTKRPKLIARLYLLFEFTPIIEIFGQRLAVIENGNRLGLLNRDLFLPPCHECFFECHGLP